MKERPILFSAPMVRAILEGKKTQTRRVIKPQPHPVPPTGWYADAYNKTEEWSFWGARGTPDQGKCTLPLFKCPYGKPGDHLWVRETFGTRGNETFYRASPPEGVVGILGLDGNKWKPSIHMPRRFSRISLEITGIRVERLQEISQKDAISEGAPPSHHSIDKISKEYGYADFSRSWFAQLWKKINGPDSWADNPWVWVVEFRRIKP